MKTMKSKLNSVLNEEVERSMLSQDELKAIKEQSRIFVERLERAIKSLKIKADVFIGGSLAKGTMIKKKMQDVDIFLRFYNKENLNAVEKIAKKAGIKHSLIHGSRDYLQSKENDVLFELIPVIKISNPKQAENVTDLSYFHVNYVLKALRKKPGLRKDIILAKSFCHAQKCYGAESYIKGFSGYALELMIIHYNGFLNMIKKITSSKDEKIVVDPKKHYKKFNVLYELNASKLDSPIVFIDPTFKERNALAALSIETFNRFKSACLGFLKNPNKIFFIEKEISEDKLRKEAKSKKREFAVFIVSTNKQKGDIAGTKLLKFSNFFKREMEKYFIDVRTDFYYDDNQTAKIFISGKKIKEFIREGPSITKVENLLNFRKKYGNRVFIKNHVAFAKIKLDYSFKKAFEVLKEMHKKTIKDMDVSNIKIED